MPQVLEKIIDEFNPEHDFKRVKHIDVYGDIERSLQLSGKEYLLSFGKQALQNLYTLVNTAKHVLRGGVVGGLVGLGISGISDIDTGKAVALGISHGILIDVTQYLGRAYITPIVKHIQNTFSKKDKNSVDYTAQ